MHKAFLRQEEDSCTFQLPQHYPAARSSLCMAVSVSHFSSCLWFPFGTIHIHPGNPQRGHQFIPHKQPPAAWLNCRIFTTVPLSPGHLCPVLHDKNRFSIQTTIHSSQNISPEQCSAALQSKKASLLESMCSVLWCMNTTPRFSRFCRRKDRNTGSARQERRKMNSNTIVQSRIWSENQAKDN